MKFTNAIRPAMAAIVLSAAFAAATPARAQGPTGTYATGVTCTNLDTALPATLVITFYNADNDVAAFTYPDPNTVAPGASRLYFTPSSFPGLSTGFIGSAVVSSDRALACNVNTQVVTPGVGTASTPARVGTSAGLDSSQGASVVYAVQVVKAVGTFSSYVALQNIDSVPVEVTVSYKSRAGVDPGANEVVTIKPQATHLFYPANNPNIPTNFIGAAKFSSTSGKLVGTVAIYNSGATAATAQFLSYNTVSGGAKKLSVPRYVMNYYGNQSGLTVVNLGTVPTPLKITYTFQGVDYVVTTPPVAPGAVYANYAKDEVALAAVNNIDTTKRTGSAVVEATADGALVAAIVNEDNRGECSAPTCGTLLPTGWGATYNAFADGSATNTVFFAQVTSKATVNEFNGGIQIVNATATPGTCTVTYAGVPAATQTGLALGASSSVSVYLPNVPGMTTGFNSAVKAVCTVPVFGISNLSSRAPAYLGDTFTQGNGLNQ